MAEETVRGNFLEDAVHAFWEVFLIVKKLVQAIVQEGVEGRSLNVDEGLEQLLIEPVDGATEYEKLLDVELREELPLEQESLYLLLVNQPISDLVPKQVGQANLLPLWWSHLFKNLCLPPNSSSGHLKQTYNLDFVEKFREW